MTPRANDSSSSATSRPDSPPLEIDLQRTKRLPKIPTALLENRDRDLVAPLQFLPPGELPLGDLGPRPPAADRAALAAALGKTAGEYDHPRAADLASRLADPKTKVVITGQQPGLYGGPLLALSKMAAALRYAEALVERGEPAVAIFWVATEDHDWQEATHFHFLHRGGTAEYDLGEDPAPLTPLAERRLGDELDGLAERVISDLDTPLLAESFGLARRFYAPGTSFGEGFCRLMIDLLGERAPLFLDAADPAIKKLQAPWLERFIERRAAVDAALDRAHADLEKRDYPRQVTPQPGTSPLFLVEDGIRRRIVWKGADEFTLRGLDAPPRPVAELLRIAHEEPERLSPGVLARPAIQDALVGTALQIMGPSELSYMAQASAVYEVVEAPAPFTTLRPQVLLLEERQIEQLGELGVSLGELFEKPTEQIVAERLGEDLVGPTRKRVREALEEMKGAILELDPNLEKPWEKTRDALDRSLEKFAGKVTAAVARQNEVWLRRLERIREQCLPDGQFQERRLSVAHFLARYGPPFVEVFWRDFKLDSRRLQVLRIPRGDDA